MNSISNLKQRVVVISNHLPLTLKRTDDGWEAKPSSGGLATAMSPILRETGGIWIGWAGDFNDAEDSERNTLLDRWAQEEGYITVDIPSDVAKGFYEGYSNQTL